MSVRSSSWSALQHGWQPHAWDSDRRARTHCSPVAVDTTSRISVTTNDNACCPAAAPNHQQHSHPLHSLSPSPCRRHAAPSHCANPTHPRTTPALPAAAPPHTVRAARATMSSPTPAAASASASAPPVARGGGSTSSHRVRVSATTMMDDDTSTAKHELSHTPVRPAAGSEGCVCVVRACVRGHRMLRATRPVSSMSRRAHATAPSHRLVLCTKAAESGMPTTPKPTTLAMAAMCCLPKPAPCHTHTSRTRGSTTVRITPSRLQEGAAKEARVRAMVVARHSRRRQQRGGNAPRSMPVHTLCVASPRV